MPREQVKSLPRDANSLDRSRLAPDEMHDLNEIVKTVSHNFSQALQEIMIAQGRRRREKDS